MNISSKRSRTCWAGLRSPTTPCFARRPNMPEMSPRRRSAKRQAARGSTGFLGQAAERVCSLAERLRNQQATAAHLAALQQRRDQFSALAIKATGLAEAARALRAA